MGILMSLKRKGETISKFFLFLAKTRMKTLNGVTSRTHLPHGLFDNQQTHYDSVRLLKGGAPGREQVSYYAGELNCIRNSKMFASKCQSGHLTEISKSSRLVLPAIFCSWSPQE